MFDAGIEVFSTCPPSKGEDPVAYRKQVADISRWSERAGCRGMLIYTDNGLVDPWLLAQFVIESTDQLCPLVAIQPVYMHPYSVARMVSSLASMYGRRIYLNMVAGGFVNDLKALDDETEHDDRYRRLVEYTTIATELLRAEADYSFSGDYYLVRDLVLRPPLSSDLFPGVFVSGSSPAGAAAAQALGATAVKYPKHWSEEMGTDEPGAMRLGMRVGILARETTGEAWDVALSRFPEDRKGQITHRLAMQVSDSRWHRQLSQLGEMHYSDDHPYWLGPFENYKTFCPYLVGSYSRVGEELYRYMALGFRTFILDVPCEDEDFDHIGVAFAEAVSLASS
jgi:alkanesulfonate monooxygenase